MTSRARTFPRLVALVTAMVLVLAACGGGDPTVLSSPVIEPVVDSDVGAAGTAPDTGDDVAAPDDVADAADEVAVPEAPAPTAEPEPNQAEDPLDGDAAPEELAFNFDAFTDEGADEESTDPADSAGDAGPDGAGIEATTVAALGQGVSSTMAQTSYRWESHFAMRVADGTLELDVAPDEPVLVGEVAGSVTSVSVDLGAILDEIFAALGSPQSATSFFGNDLTMTLIDDGMGSLYIQAPLLAAVADSTGIDGADKLERLADGWGVIDLIRADSVDASQLASLAGAQSGGTPDALLALLASPAAGSVEEIGSAEIRGVTTTAYTVEVSLGDLVAAQGLDDDDLTGLAGTTIADLPDRTLPVDVFVDDAGLIRRIEVDLDLGVFGAGVLPAGSVFAMASTLDLFDFGADVDIDVPDGNIVVDLTNEVDTLFG